MDPQTLHVRQAFWYCFEGKKVDHQNFGSQFSVFENHGSLASSCRAQKDRVVVERVWLVTHSQRSPDVLLLRGDSHGYQETSMRSWKT